MASFRQLFVKSEQQPAQAQESERLPPWRSAPWSAYYSSSKPRSSTSGHDGSFTRKLRHHETGSLPDESMTNIIPLDIVGVCHDV